jgi:hypothetical protein
VEEQPLQLAGRAQALEEQVAWTFRSRGFRRAAEEQKTMPTREVEEHRQPEAAEERWS